MDHNTKLYSTSISREFEYDEALMGSKVTSEIYTAESYLLYCPACHQQYDSSLSQQHLDKHYMVASYDFRVIKQKSIEKDLNTTRVTNYEKVEYPMVEPMQFNTKEINQVQRKNFYKIEVIQSNKKAPEVVQLKSTEVQTINKPAFQSTRRQSDCYNCLDNLFNAKTKFSIDDITKNNTGLASKRKFTEWEQWYLSKK